MLRNRLRGAVVVLSSLLVATGSPVVLTRLLEKAFEKDSELPGAEQNEFAELIPDVLESERRWKHALGAHRTNSNGSPMKRSTNVRPGTLRN